MIFTCSEAFIYRFKKIEVEFESDFSRPCPDGTWLSLKEELQSPFHNTLHALHIKAASERLQLCCM